MAFQPTLPARGATRTTTRLKRWSNDFNPRSPHGERREVSKRLCGHDYFNPRSPHGERPQKMGKALGVTAISTHAPHTGSDVFQRVVHQLFHTFQPTLPTRGATLMEVVVPLSLLFQPTLPARGATFGAADAGAQTGDFNPRSPHGERPLGSPENKRERHFNPRSPHGERPYVIK